MNNAFYSPAHKAHFHKKGFALSLILKVRDFGTWKKRNISLLRLTTARPMTLAIFKREACSRACLRYDKTGNKNVHLNLLCNIAAKRVQIYDVARFTTHV